MNKRLKALSVSNLYAKKFEPFPLGDGEFRQLFSDELPRGGVWLVHGDEKQGKTTLCLSLANYLSVTNKVLYIQAEQSSDEKDIDKIFIEAMQRIGIEINNRRLTFLGDVGEEDLIGILSRKRSADVIFIDNITFATWVDTAVVRKLSKRFKNKTFIYIAHNDRNGDPNGSTGKAIRKLANTIFIVDGLMCTVIGRGSWGGTLSIDWQKGLVMYGKNINPQNNK